MLRKPGAWMFFALLLGLLGTGTGSNSATAGTLAVDDSIQVWIDRADVGDTLLVAPGVYTGALNKNLDFGGKSLVLSAEQGPETTIIDCESDGRAFDFHSGEGSAAVVEGFTIINGRTSDDGGAFRCIQASPTIRNCVAQANRADNQGGALYCDNASPQLIDCLITGNVSGGDGGGIACESASAPEFWGTTVSGNFAHASGGGIFCGGANTDTLWIRTSIVWDNCADGPGEEVYVGPSALISFACSDVDSLRTAGTGEIGYEGDHNIFVDPLFCGTRACTQDTSTAGDYQLYDWSPCVAGHSPCGEQIGARGSGCQGSLTLDVPSPYPTIRAAIDAACPGATIRVAAGTYTGSGNKNLDFGGKNITLVGLEGPQTTIIDCQDDGRAFDFQRGEDHTSVVEGFSIRNGSVVSQGGAIRIVGASPTIRDCILSGNAVALLNEGKGGAIYCRDASPEIFGCLITGNFSAGDGGAIACDSIAEPHVVSCTISSNWANGDGGGLIVEGSSYVTVEQTILWGNCSDRGQGAHVTGLRDTLSFACSNFRVDHNSGPGLVITPDVNVFSDPLFCDPDPCGQTTGGDYSIDRQSPCLGENNACGVDIGALGPACGLAKSPQIISILDVPNDQGRQVRVTWQRSGLDIAGSPNWIAAYEVYRQIDSTLADPSPILPAASMGDDWDFLEAVPAHAKDRYSVVVPTLADSTLFDGVHYSVFAIRAATGIATVFFDSDPDSGYSMDNLAPSMPPNLILSSEALLTWGNVPEEDFKYFTVYGSGSEVFDSAAEVIGYTTDARMDVQAFVFDYYHVTATDFAGNEGPAATAPGSGVPVRLAFFHVQRKGEKAELTWEVAEATEHAGFHVYRQEIGARRIQLTDELLRGRRRYEFVDESVPMGQVDYWLAELSRAGTITWHGPETVSPSSTRLPVLFLAPGQPNPFTSSTRISYTLPEARPVKLRVYDLLGRPVATLVDEVQGPGDQLAVWDGRLPTGALAPAGLYIIQLTQGGDVRTQKIALFR